MKRRKSHNPLIPIQNAQLLAIEGRLTNTLDSFERRVRRWFSKEHSTPYLDTFKLPWDELLLHYYESNLANKSFNEVYDLAVTEYLPEFIEEAEDKDQAFADSLLKDQEEALRKNEAKTMKDMKNQSKEPGEANKSEKQQSIKNKPGKRPLPKTMSLKFDESLEEEIDPE